MNGTPSTAKSTPTRSDEEVAGVVPSRHGYPWRFGVHGRLIAPLPNSIVAITVSCLARLNERAATVPSGLPHRQAGHSTQGVGRVETAFGFELQRCRPGRSSI